MNKKVLLFPFIFSCILVVLSPLVFPIKVNSFSDLKTLRFGYPFPFIEQSSTALPNKKDFPLTITMLNPIENVTQILIGNLLLSIIIVMLYYLIAWFFIDKIFLKRKKTVRSKIHD